MPSGAAGGRHPEGAGASNDQHTLCETSAGQGDSGDAPADRRRDRRNRSGACEASPRTPSPGDRACVEAATRGQDAVLSALGHKRWFYPTRILSAGTSNTLNAMEACGIRRFVWDTRRQERLIRASGVDRVIVRPGVLTNGPRRGVYRHGPGAGHWLWTGRISRADAANFMLDQVTSARYLRTAPGVCWQESAARARTPRRLTTRCSLRRSEGAAWIRREQTPTANAGRVQ